MRGNTGALPKRTRTRLDREKQFVMWVHSARIEMVRDRSVAELARDYGVGADFVRGHLAKRMARG